MHMETRLQRLPQLQSMQPSCFVSEYQSELHPNLEDIFLQTQGATVPEPSEDIAGNPAQQRFLGTNSKAERYTIVFATFHLQISVQFQMEPLCFPKLSDVHTIQCYG